MKKQGARLILFLAMILTARPGSANRTDIVVLSNGDRLTGDIKIMERGKLKFKTDATDNIYLKWDDITRLSSNKTLQVELQSGARYTGRLLPQEEDLVLRLTTEREEVIVFFEEVVYIVPIETVRRERIEGKIRAGYNFTQASGVTQLNYGLDTTYRTTLNIFNLKLDGNLSDTENDEKSARSNGSFRYIVLRPGRWLLGLGGFYERNDELGLENRVSVGGGGGRDLIQTNHTALAVTGALLVSREETIDTVGKDNTLESSFNLDYDWFRYDNPELDFSVDLQVVPSLSDFGRVRANLNVDLDWEIVNDLYINLNFYDAYDSQASGEDTVKNDYGIVTSIVWKL
ncbi:MAG: DUF481 domain-containing protein [Acidobacteriota bacterium]|nr:DUF481 domain-containing protein [Acidobacteriota bacterium]